MRSEWSPLAPTFRSRLQGSLLALVLLRPGEEWSISDLARRLDAPLTTVQGEVSRLVDGRVLSERKVGRTRLVTANSANPAVPPLTHLTLVTFGPHLVIGEEFSRIGADAVYIFGSWAARFHGETGPVPRDIDVLVVGDRIDPHAMFEAARRASESLGIEVNPVSRTPQQFRNAAADPLLGDLLTKPTVLAWGEAS